MILILEVLNFHTSFKVCPDDDDGGGAGGHRVIRVRTYREYDHYTSWVSDCETSADSKTAGDHGRCTTTTSTTITVFMRSGPDLLVLIVTLSLLFPPSLLLLPLSVGAIDDSLLLMLFWILTGLSVLGLFSQRYGLQPLTIALILRSIYHLGIGNTLILLGSLNVRNTPLPIYPRGTWGTLCEKLLHPSMTCPLWSYLPLSKTRNLFMWKLDVCFVCSSIL